MPGWKWETHFPQDGFDIAILILILICCRWQSVLGDSGVQNLGRVAISSAGRGDFQ